MDSLVRMRTRRAAVVFGFLCVVARPVAAQQVMVDLGAEVVILTPGATVDLPVTLSAPDEGPVQIAMEVGFPTDTLEYVDVRAGLSVDTSDATLKVEPRPAEAGAEQVLAIDIRSVQPLTSGTLALLQFKFTDAARPGMDIPLRNLSRTAKGQSGGDIATRGTEGLITLVEPPAPCFFYMH